MTHFTFCFTSFKNKDASYSHFLTALSAYGQPSPHTKSHLGHKSLQVKVRPTLINKFTEKEQLNKKRSCFVRSKQNKDL